MITWSLPAWVCISFFSEMIFWWETIAFTIQIKSNTHSAESSSVVLSSYLLPLGTCLFFSRSLWVPELSKWAKHLWSAANVSTSIILFSLKKKNADSITNKWGPLLAFLMQSMQNKRGDHTAVATYIFPKT